MEKVYDILFGICGANPLERERFYQYFKNTELPLEWRFQGKLGFGGKFYKTHEKMYVSCYPEDMNPKRMSVITRANNKLAQITP